MTRRLLAVLGLLALAIFDVVHGGPAAYVAPLPAMVAGVLLGRAAYGPRRRS